MNFASATLATALTLLLRLGHLEGLRLMLREWKDVLIKPEAEREARQLSVFLTGCGRLEAIQALAEDLRKRPPKHRFWVIERLSGQDESRIMRDLLAGGWRLAFLPARRLARRRPGDHDL